MMSGAMNDIGIYKILQQVQLYNTTDKSRKCKEPVQGSVQKVAAGMTRLIKIWVRKWTNMYWGVYKHFKSFH